MIPHALILCYGISASCLHVSYFKKLYFIHATFVVIKASSLTVKSWSDAKTACQNDGGALTSINDVYESGFVYTLASSKGAYWIGLSDERVRNLYCPIIT